MNEAYRAGFEKECECRGVDPAVVVKLAQIKPNQPASTWAGGMAAAAGPRLGRAMFNAPTLAGAGRIAGGGVVGYLSQPVMQGVASAAGAASGAPKGQRAADAGNAYSDSITGSGIGKGMTAGFTKLMSPSASTVRQTQADLASRRLDRVQPPPVQPNMSPVLKTPPKPVAPKSIKPAVGTETTPGFNPGRERG